MQECEKPLGVLSLALCPLWFNRFALDSRLSTRHFARGGRPLLDVIGAFVVQSTFQFAYAAESSNLAFSSSFLALPTRSLKVVVRAALRRVETR